jgi:serine/threonine protein kinase
VGKSTACPHLLPKRSYNPGISQRGGDRHGSDIRPKYQGIRITRTDWRGGFGAVYRAYQTTVGREVAIKIILPGLANQPDFIRRFETEAQLVARLEHPFITPLYDYWRDLDGAYLVMRWLRGGSLRDSLQKGPFDLRSPALLLDQVARDGSPECTGSQSH